MIRNSILPSAAAILIGATVAACGSSQSEETDTNVIAVAQAIANPTEIKVSDLGSKLRYVPLETTDSSLVPQKWYLVPTDKQLLVVNYNPWGTTYQNCLSFDKNGKFLGAIGYVGEDTEAYSTPFPLVSTDEKALYFSRWSTTKYLQKYSVGGKYLGKAFPSIPPLCQANSTQIMDSTIMSPYGVFQDGQLYMTVYSGDFNGHVDTLPVNPLPPAGIKYYSYQSATIDDVPGVLRNSIVSYREVNELSGEKKHHFSADRTIPKFWRTGDKYHYREPFFDTIQSVTPASFEVAYIFDCGEKALKPAEINTKGINPDNLWVTEMCETPDYIVFGASKGWLGSDTHSPFIGYFNKKTGKTFACPTEKGFVDDLTGFMPFQPVLATPNGELIGVLTIDDINDWMDAHPDAKLPAELENLAEDANPVCVILSK